MWNVVKMLAKANDVPLVMVAASVAEALLAGTHTFSLKMRQAWLANGEL